MIYNYKEVMSKKTDSDLIKMLTLEREQFQSDALAAAEEELKRRNLTLDQIETVKKENEIKYKQNEDNAKEPLGIPWKLLAFFLPGIIVLAFSGAFKADGYEKKAKDLARWTLYGVGFYFTITIIISLF